MQASLPALVAHRAIDVLCVIMSHGFRYHTINSLELERTIYDDLVQFPHSEQGHPHLDQLAQGLIQSCLESLWEHQPHLWPDRKSTRLKVTERTGSRMPSSA